VNADGVLLHTRFADPYSPFQVDYWLETSLLAIDFLLSSLYIGTPHVEVKHQLHYYWYLSIMEKKPKEARTPLTGFASINEDLVQNILKRTPASSFASAACVCKSWNQTCNQILSKPKLASAFSLNPDQKVCWAFEWKPTNAIIFYGKSLTWIDFGCVFMMIKQVASQEVVNKVLSEPIRPQFAIANVIGSGVDLSETLNFVRFISKLCFFISCYEGNPQC